MVSSVVVLCRNYSTWVNVLIVLLGLVEFLRRMVSLVTWLVVWLLVKVSELLRGSLIVMFLLGVSSVALTIVYVGLSFVWLSRSVARVSRLPCARQCVRVILCFSDRCRNRPILVLVRFLLLKCCLTLVAVVVMVLGLFRRSYGRKYTVLLVSVVLGVSNVEGTVLVVVLKIAIRLAVCGLRLSWRWMSLFLTG